MLGYGKNVIDVFEFNHLNSFLSYMGDRKYAISGSAAFLPAWRYVKPAVSNT
jgi:hypothetical protein